MTIAIQLMTALVTGVLLLLLSTVVFDGLHFLLHRWMHSPSRHLRKLGALHHVHHRFLDRHLRIHHERIAANVGCHVIPEFLVQIMVTGWLGLWFPVGAVYVAWTLETFVLLMILKPTPGMDINHRPIDKLAAYRPLYFCVPEYHLLHHVYPDAHFSSWIKTLDHLLGTGFSLKGRRIFPVGDHPIRQTLTQQLSANGATVCDDFRNSPAAGDVLLVCLNASQQGNIAAIAAEFSRLHQEDRFPCEIWQVLESGFDAAGKILDQHHIQYRYLMLPCAEPKERQIQSLVKNIKRGFSFVPAGFGGYALRHYLQFVTK